MSLNHSWPLEAGESQELDNESPSFWAQGKPKEPARITRHCGPAQLGSKESNTIC